MLDVAWSVRSETGKSLGSDSHPQGKCRERCTQARDRVSNLVSHTSMFNEGEVPMKTCPALKRNSGDVVLHTAFVAVLPCLARLLFFNLVGERTPMGAPDIAQIVLSSQACEVSARSRCGWRGGYFR